MNVTPLAFTLRPMQPSDLDQVLAIAEQSPEAPRWPPSSYTPYLTGAASQTNPALLRTALVATTSSNPDQPNKEKIQAFAAATLLLVPDSAGQQNLCSLDSMAVHPTARRRGLGLALLRAILAWSARHNARHLTLEVRAGNAPALALYQLCGFRPEGLRTRYYTDPEEDALLLGMDITSGPPHVGFPR
ncbi:MAG: GNAT family N-acetyltransferase [Acidobacteriaceae bacterium]